jgi:Mg2+-importing ATPase
MIRLQDPYAMKVNPVTESPPRGRPWPAGKFEPFAWEPSTGERWLPKAAQLPLAELLEQLQSSPAGLAWPVARQRLQQTGPNIAMPRQITPWYILLWHSFRNPFNYILVFLGVVSYLTEEWRSTLVMAIMVGLATGLRFWQEFRSQVKAESLREMVRNLATVYRADNEGIPRVPHSLDHRASEVLMEELVPGDIVKLSAGDMIPADVRLIESRDLFVSQSTLTGEALPVEKDARLGAPAARAPAVLELSNLCFMGSSVVSGTAKAVVLATGPRTQMGALASKLVLQRPLTSFDRGVNKVSWLLIKFMLVMVPIVFLINGLTKGNWLEAFFFGVAVAVGLTPEMLPMIVNTNLARGAVAMAKEKVVVKHINAIQNFGAMDVLCTDKTGTLTQDKVVLIRHFDAHGQESDRVLQNAYLNSLFQSGLKNLLDRAVIERAQTVQQLREIAGTLNCIDELPFDFSRRRMSVVVKPASYGAPLLVCKGAVDEMLQICTKIEHDGEVTGLTDELRDKLHRLRDSNNEDGLRLVAVAYKSADKTPGEFSVADEHDLIFSGFIAFLDPPKETTPEALRLLRGHGVTVKILTGDNALVARKVCRDVGLEVDEVLLGGELQTLEDEELHERVEHTTIFAKLNPAQKARVIKALKHNGHTVGFLGDGINDALALRESDVGISVDSGADIAKEAADIILLEKSLLVLERGVVWGRRTFGNIIKYIKMTASSNFGNMFSVLVASAFLPFFPMLAIQILINNLLYDISQMSIPWDRMDEEWLKKPRQWGIGSIARFMIFIGPISSIFDITTFLVLWYAFGANSLARQGLFQTAWFIESLLTQTLIVHMIRTEKIPFLQSTAARPVVLLTTAIMAIGCYLPFSPLAGSVGMVHLPWDFWPFLAVTILSYCLLTQLLKQLYIRRFKEWL